MLPVRTCQNGASFKEVSGKPFLANEFPLKRALQVDILCQELSQKIT